jgi:hypothetical protein
VFWIGKSVYDTVINTFDSFIKITLLNSNNSSVVEIVSKSKDLKRTKSKDLKSKQQKNKKQRFIKQTKKNQNLRII